MPSKSSPPRSPMHALELFTDRDSERKVIWDFLQGLASDKDRPRKPILSFYGVGGVGKSTLQLRACADFSEAEKSDLYRRPGPSVAIAVVDLDDERIKEDYPIPDLFWQVRSGLNKAGVRTPIFDYLYLVYWEHEFPGQARPRLGPSLETAQDVWDVSSAIYAILQDAASVVQLPLKGLDALKNALQHWYHKSQSAKRYRTHPEGWDQKTRVARMHEILADDLIEGASAVPAICMVVDGFERLQSRQPKDDAQCALQRFLGDVVLSTASMEDGCLAKDRIGFIVLGREKLRWHQLYDEPHTQAPWDDFIEAHLLDGLAEADARDFLLNKSVPRFKTDREIDVAHHIETHVDAILRAALEDAKSAKASYLPYFLDLAVQLIQNTRERFTPDMLGQTPNELQIRFLRYLPDLQRKALQALALCLSFDADLFVHLIRGQRIMGYAPQDFAKLVGEDHSYVGTDPALPGFRHFHRHMQDSLIRSQTVTVDDRQGIAEVIQDILTHLAQRAHFDRPAECTQAQLIAYRLAMTILQAHWENGLMPVERVLEWWARLNEPFDWQYSTAIRLPFQRWLVSHLTQLRGERHPNTLSAMHDLGLTLLAQGEFAEARVLQEKVLEQRRELLGEEHPDTLSATNSLATTLRAQGEVTEARALQEAVLERSRKVLGEEHPDTLTAMGYLALVLRAQGELTEARALEKALLEKSRKVLGEEHPDTLTAMGYLAVTLDIQGKQAEARKVQEEVLEKCRRQLGEEHPQTLTAMGNLALMLRAQGDFAEARAVQETVLEKRRELLGKEHPDTLTAMGYLAITAYAQGELDRARTLQEEVLETRRRRLGVEHPQTLTAMGNLVPTLRAQGKLAEARELQEAMLEKRRKLQGEEHLDTLIAMGNLAVTLGEEGEEVLAREMLDRALASLLVAAGAAHPARLDFMAYLAKIFDAMGDEGRAKALRAEISALRSRP